MPGGVTLDTDELMLELERELGANEDEEVDDGTKEDELERELGNTEELELDVDGIKDDELERLLLERLILLLERLVEVTTLDDVPQLAKPNGAGWLVQVAREIQLLLFS